MARDFVAGQEGIQSSLIIKDKDLKTDAFADHLNCLLGSGHIPGLLDSECIGNILAELRPAAEAAGVSDEQEAMMDFFLSRLKANLHILICISPLGNKLRDYCRYSLRCRLCESSPHK